MSTERVFLAVDLGAESGRVMAGAYDGERLRLEELHRFPNEPVTRRGHRHWDIRGLFEEIKTGLAKAAETYGSALVSVGVDTWGVDYGLLDAEGRLLGDPFHYRDARTDGMQEKVYQKVSRKELYRATGIQSHFFNTLYQLYSELDDGPAALERAERMLFTPDLISFWLAGRAVNERTIASTSQLLDPRTGNWAGGLLEKLGIPEKLFGEVVPPGTVLGPVLPEIAAGTGAEGLNVVAVGSHDTASAVAAVPAGGEGHAFLSSGTWSLMGVDSPGPVITERTLEYGFSNESGVCETITLLKNISGLWLVQECRRAWADQGEKLSYDDLTRMAGQAPPFAAIIDPNYAEFAHPGNMPEKIARYCRATGQAPPADKGATVRTALESLALSYRQTFDQLEEVTGRCLDALHIIGGGSQNRLLNQFAADATGRTVTAGPVEATSAGNILMQMIAREDLASLAEGRALVRRSWETEVYTPSDTSTWDEAFDRFTNSKKSAAPECTGR